MTGSFIFIFFGSGSLGKSYFGWVVYRFGLTLFCVWRVANNNNKNANLTWIWTIEAVANARLGLCYWHLGNRVVYTRGGGGGGGGNLR